MSLNLLIIYIIGHLDFPNPTFPICTFVSSMHTSTHTDSRFVYVLTPQMLWSMLPTMHCSTWNFTHCNVPCWRWCINLGNEHETVSTTTGHYRLRVLCWWRGMRIQLTDRGMETFASPSQWLGSLAHRLLLWLPAVACELRSVGR